MEQKNNNPFDFLAMLEKHSIKVGDMRIYTGLLHELVHNEFAKLNQGQTNLATAMERISCMTELLENLANERGTDVQLLLTRYMTGEEQSA